MLLISLEGLKNGKYFHFEEKEESYEDLGASQ
jgi:hypothetical protein